MRRITLLVSGSMRTTDSSPSATQIAPSPAATATGVPPTRARSLTASVAASMRVTFPSSRLATQTLPKPTASAAAALPTPIV